MQYLLLEGNETLTSLSRMFGQSSVSDILAENGLPRTPNVAKEWDKKCQQIIDSDTKQVSAERKIILLNGLTNSDDIFEKACLMDEDEWKVFAATQAFTDALKIPESVLLPYSTKIMGSSPMSPISTTPNSSVSGLNITSTASVQSEQSRMTIAGSSGKQYSTVPRVTSSGSSGQVIRSSSNPVSSVTYKAVIKSLKATGEVDPTIFNAVNTGPGVPTSTGMIEATSSPWAYNLPWGKIQMYSTVLKETIDFPVYPEQIEVSRQANYASMPDVIYQYEPWITFQDSGPREQSLDFHIHRDMWSGDHRDGQANKLIKFCQANTFADYNGSAVITPLIRLYIDGSLFISGVIKNANVNWSGPIGLDNWYLEFTLSLAIQEISKSTLNCKSFYKRSLKEG